jgi:tRNA (guanine-N7-)-methyltransferase
MNLFEYSLISYSEKGYKIKDISLDYHKREDKDNIMTEYEEKFSKKGQPIYMVKVEK